MTDNFDDMMEYVEGYKPKEGDVFDFIEYKVTKGKIIFVRRKGQEEWLFRSNRTVIPFLIGHLRILSLSKLNIFQSVRLGKDIFRFSHRFSF